MNATRAPRRLLRLEVNGEAHELSVEPRRSLAEVLREELGLTGTHLGCEHGVCGACTVLLDGESVRSCLLFAVQAEGARIRTVESLSEGGALHPIQEAFSEQHGLQCGFCTPGFLMATLELLSQEPDPTREQILEALSGNLCRCTGYRDIVRSVEAAARKLRERPDASGGPR